MPSPSQNATAHQVRVLEAVVSELAPGQVTAAAAKVRALKAAQDEIASEFYETAAIALERYKTASYLDPDRLSDAPPLREVGRLDDSVRSTLEEKLSAFRGVMFNRHGEILAYTNHDLLYHSDMDWGGYKWSRATCPA
jgi:hypothetical protein